MLHSRLLDLAAMALATGGALWVLACTEPHQPAETDPLGQMHTIDPPADGNALAPNLSVSRSGHLISTWLEKKGDDETSFVELRMAELDTDSWTEPETLVSSSNMFANWADLPGVIETRSGSRVAHWLGMLGEGTYSYGIRLMASNDAAHNWQDVGLLHADDTSPTEHGFVSSVVATGQGIQMFWLDGRAMASEGPMQLRTAFVDPDDEHHPIGAGTVLDPRVCECCSTDAALTNAGPVVVYRNRGEDETRDISIVRAEGNGWSRPHDVHADGWKIHGCPVNGPAVAASGSLVAVAWFTAPSDQAQVRVAFSTDAGESFSPPVILDSEKPIGRVDAVMDGDRGAFVSWIASKGEDAEVRLARVDVHGQLIELRSIAPTSAERSAGVPRLVRTPDRLFLTWIEDDRIRVGYISLDS